MLTIPVFFINREITHDIANITYHGRQDNVLPQMQTCLCALPGHDKVKNGPTYNINWWQKWEFWRKISNKCIKWTTKRHMFWLHHGISWQWSTL